MNDSNGMFVFLAVVLILFLGMFFITLNPDLLGSNLDPGTADSKPAPIADEPELISDEPGEVSDEPEPTADQVEP